MTKQLKTRQICFFLIAFLPVTKIFTLPSILAENSAEDMWLSALFSLIFDFLTLLAVVFTCRKTNMSFFELLEYNLGKTGKNIVLVIYFICFTIKAYLPIVEQKEYVELTLYTLTPATFYFLPFFFAGFYLCLKNLRVLGRASDVAFLITLIGFLILFALSIANADFSAILPIGASGFNKIIGGSFKSLTWFGDSAYLLFFIGNFKYEKKSGVKILISFIISAIIVLGFMLTFYAIFTSIAHRQRFALTEISKYTTVINNLGRFDYLGIICILFSSVISLSLPIYFCTHILNHIFKLKKVYIAPLITVGAQFLAIMFLSKYMASVQKFITEYGGFLFFTMSNVIPILIALFCKKEKKYEVQQG